MPLVHTLGAVVLGPVGPHGAVHLVRVRPAQGGVVPVHACVHAGYDRALSDDAQVVPHTFRPDEANAAQSRVATKGRHRFIDKVYVNYVEKERRHWAALENFGSQRISISERFYRDNDRLLEGGIWAEVTIGYNDIDEDRYAFYVEDLRPYLRRAWVVAAPLLALPSPSKEEIRSR